jgi:hypothetical protein
VIDTATACLWTFHNGIESLIHFGELLGAEEENAGVTWQFGLGSRWVMEMKGPKWLELKKRP